jgi:hypothetical protein
MRKVLVSLIILGFATVAFAEDKKEEPKTQLNVALSALTYGAAYSTVAKDTNGSNSAVRLRPMLTFTNGSFDGVLQLQYDGMFGAASGKAYDDSTNYNVGLEGKHSNLLVRQAYLSAKVDDLPGLKLIGGISPYDFPLVFGDVAPMFGASFEKGIVTASLYYGKTYEDKQYSETDDGQFGILDLTFKIGDQTIRPALFYISGGKNVDTAVAGAQYADDKGIIAAVTANLVLGKGGIDLSAAYVNGKDKVNDMKYSSYAADFAPYFKLNDTFKFTGFFTYVSGDDKTTDGTNSSFIAGTLDGYSAGINSWRLYIIEDGGTFGKFSDVSAAGKYTNTNGYMAFGLVVDASLGKLTATAKGAYVSAAKVASGAKKDMGLEFDLNVGYAVTKGATLFAEGAYLKTGDFYKTAAGKQDAKYINVGLSASL